MKKRILAMLLCLSMAMQLTGYVGANEEDAWDEILIEEAEEAETEPIFDVYEDPAVDETEEETPADEEMIEEIVEIGEPVEEEAPAEETEEADEEEPVMDEILEEDPAEEEAEAPADEVVEIELVEEEIILDINTELEAGAFGSDGVMVWTYDALYNHVMTEATEILAQLNALTDPESEILATETPDSLFARLSAVIDTIAKAENDGTVTQEELTMLDDALAANGIDLWGMYDRVSALIGEDIGEEEAVTWVTGRNQYFLHGVRDIWNDGTEEKTVTPSSGNENDKKTFYTNTTAIAWDNIATDGTTTFYVFPGMGLKFDTSMWWWLECSTNQSESWDIETYRGGRYYQSTKWTWIYDGTNNYALFDADFTTTTTVILTLANAKTPTEKRTVNVIIQKPQLLEDALVNRTDYSIKSLPITLYNYDGDAFNKYYTAKSNKGYFAFSGKTGKTDVGSNRAWATGSSINAGGSTAIMGILQPTLGTDKLPHMAGGQDVDLFSTDTLNEAKTIYEQVGFQFIYDEASGYYAYDSSLNHAQYIDDGTKKEIKLYVESLSPNTNAGGSQTNPEQGDQAGFYPFADINASAVRAINSGMSLEEKLDSLDGYSDDNSYSTYKKHCAEFGLDNVFTNHDDSTMDLHFGLQMTLDFYLPEDKMTDDDNPIIYEFTGDDDLWVFIDDQLVLDIGGGHTQVSGSIDITNGSATVNEWRKVEYVADSDNWSVTTGTGTNTVSFEIEGGKMHTLRVFYLERHAGISNCKMRFNIPVAPANSVSVTKNPVVNEDGAEKFAVSPDEEYTFMLVQQEYCFVLGEETWGDPKPLIGEYSIDGGATFKSTNEDGTFTLKAGQTALFKGVGFNNKVSVIEYEPKDGYVYTTPKVSVNGASNEDYTYNKETDPYQLHVNSSISFSFTNTIQTEDLTITKKLTGNTTPPETDSYNFTFTLDGNAYTWDATIVTGDISAIENGEFSLAAGESVTIKNIPVNMNYSIAEEQPIATDARFEYESPVYRHQENGEAIGNINSIVLTDATNTVWVINEYNRLVADLIIKKVINGEYDAHQSFLFKITGSDGFSMNVVINADDVAENNGSITIADLPLDIYTITEDMSWSPRYGEVSSESVNAKNETASGKNYVAIELKVPQLIDEATDKYTENKVTVTNKRTEIKWLDGNTQCTNIFDGISAGKHYKDEE